MNEAWCSGRLAEKRTAFPQLLAPFWDVKAVFDRVLGPAGPGRVLVSSDGFNAVGLRRG